MACLNDRAFEILQKEILRCTENSPAGKVQQELALKRLERLRVKQGTPASEEELRQTLEDLFPDFSDKVLKAAARANNPIGIGKPFKVATLLLAGAAVTVGGIWFLNLPYPPIRWPVSRVAPIILLPSFMQMDHNYRRAIALVEQSDQLVNQATSPADLELGTGKVKAAQKHLDALPVWFLGYYPRFYCSWFQCGWAFTLDEFQQARKQIARMDARLFQENNAQTQLNQADQVIRQARQQLQTGTSPTNRATAIAQWQEGMDLLRQVPATTLAGRMVQPKLMAYERDWQKVAGLSETAARSGNVISAAQEFARLAEQASAGPAHTVAEWQEIQSQWQTAIDRLQTIDMADPDYLPAQKLLAAYGQKLGQVRIRLQQEQESVQAFELAQQSTQTLVASTPSKPGLVNRNQMIADLQGIVNQLKKVKSGTTVYGEAQTLLKSAEKRLQQWQK